MCGIEKALLKILTGRVDGEDRDKGYRSSHFHDRLTALPVCVPCKGLSEIICLYLLESKQGI